MKEIIISQNEAGQRLDKFLKKYLAKAPGSFLYKMLRKKNIVLNGKKATGNEKLGVGDSVKLFLADDTIGKFAGLAPIKEEYQVSVDLDIIYEDANVLFINKPAGMLSQKAAKDDVSMVEHVIAYLLAEGSITQEELRTFRPSICNRLDRNTSGLIVAGKSLIGLQAMARLFKDRTLKKYYLCFVKGEIRRREHIYGYLAKNEKTNKVTIEEAGDTPIETEYVPIAYNQEMTLLKVHLITGRTHKIRAHLASKGHPLLGDYKYGDAGWNRQFKERYQASAQQLHAYQMELPRMEAPLDELSGMTFTAKVPPLFWRLIKETTWEHGIQEALEVQH